MQKKNRIHDWRKLKWPFTATFLYYAILSLVTGLADQSAEGFLAMFSVVLLIDAVAYFFQRTQRICTSSGSPLRSPSCSPPPTSFPSSGK